jgi:hypothetical protein
VLIHIKFLWEQYNVSLYILDEILKNSQAPNLQNRIPIQIEFKSENRKWKKESKQKKGEMTYQIEAHRTGPAWQPVWNPSGPVPLRIG